MKIPPTRIYAVSMILCALLAMLPLQHALGPQLGQMLTVTLTVFALARSLNAVISVAQGTEMSIEPMGVGLTLTPGQLLDPLNDMVEQFSAVLLLASASLGVQKILLLLGDLAVLRAVLVMIALLTLGLLVWGKTGMVMQRRMVKLVIVLTVLRLSVPALALVSHQLQSWLTDEREQALLVLQETRQDVEALNSTSVGEESSWFDGFKSQLDVRARLDQMEQKAEQGVQAAIYLLAEFVLIMVLLPVLFILLLVKLIRAGGAGSG
jgi:hypothetical protein